MRSNTDTKPDCETHDKMSWQNSGRDVNDMLAEAAVAVNHEVFFLHRGEPLRGKLKLMCLVIKTNHTNAVDVMRYQIVLDTIGISRLLSGSSTTDNRMYCKRPSPNLAYASPRGITEDSTHDIT